MRKNFFQAAATAALGAILAACGEAPAARGAGEYAALKVATTDREVTTLYSASIRGRQDIAIIPQVSGTIFQVCVKEGQAVIKGQTLFVIDQVPYKAALRTAEANVAAAEAGVATAQLTLDSKKELFSKNVVSEFDLRTAENTLLTAKASLAQAQAQEVNARNNLSYTVVKAPTNGVTGTIPFRVGALVGPSMPQPLTTVSDNSDMYVYFSMNETQLLNLTREHGSMEAALKSLPKVQLRLSDGSLYGEQGFIESISGVIDQTTGSIQLRAVFPNKGRLLHSGGTGNIAIARLNKECIVIPRSATFEIQDKVYVYKVVEGKASSSMIEVSPGGNGQEYIVKSGLVPGDIIIAEGVGLLREGMPVRIKGAEAQTEAQTQAPAEARANEQRTAAASK